MGDRPQGHRALWGYQHAHTQNPHLAGSTPAIGIGNPAPPVSGYRHRSYSHHRYRLTGLGVVWLPPEPATAGTRPTTHTACSGLFVTPPVTSWRRGQR